MFFQGTEPRRKFGAISGVLEKLLYMSCFDLSITFVYPLGLAPYGFCYNCNPTLSKQVNIVDLEPNYCASISYKHVNAHTSFEI